MIPKLSRVPPDVETLRIFLSLPLYHGFEDVSQIEVLQTPFNHCLATLNPIPAKVVANWIGEQSKDYFRKVVDNLRSAVLSVLQKLSRSGSTSAINKSLEANLKVMEILSQINRKKLIIPHENFYIDEVQSLVNLRERYMMKLYCEKRNQRWAWHGN